MSSDVVLAMVCVSLASISLIAAVWWHLYWSRRAREAQASDRKLVAELATITSDEARRRADAALSDTRAWGFTSVTTDQLDELRPRVPTAVVDVWSRYGAPYSKV